jgi:tetratricopeptide (TPR) repeat protein
MRKPVLITAVSIVAVLAVWGSLALLGWTNWGAVGWYYPWNNTPEYRLGCGEAALRGNNFDRAEEIALRLEADGFKDQGFLLRGEAFFRQGEGYYDSNQPSQAAALLLRSQKELNKIHDKGALRLAAAILIGKAQLYLRQPAEAVHAFRFVLSEDPDNIDAHRGLASIYFEQGAMQLAIQHLERVAALDPEDGRPHRLMGLIYKDLEQWNDAVVHYEEALRRRLPGQVREQDPSKVRQELAQCLLKLGQFARAQEVLRECEPLPEDEALVEALGAECFFGLNQNEQASQILDRALAAFPVQLELLRLRGKLYLSDKQPQRAVELLQRAVRLDHHDFESRYQLSLALQQLGRTAEAQEEEQHLKQTQQYRAELARLNQEAVTKPWDEQVRLRMAELCDRLEKPALATMWRRAAAECPPAPTQERPREAKPGTINQPRTP